MEGHLAGEHLSYYPFHCGHSGCGECFPTKKQLMEHLEDERHTSQILNNRDREKLNELKSLMARCEAMAEQERNPSSLPENPDSLLKVQIEDEIVDTDSASQAHSATNSKMTKSSSSRSNSKDRKEFSSSKSETLPAKSSLKERKTSTTNSTVSAPAGDKTTNEKFVTVGTTPYGGNPSTVPPEVFRLAGKKGALPALKQQPPPSETVASAQVNSPCTSCDKVPLNKENHAKIHLAKKHDQKLKGRSRSAKKRDPLEPRWCFAKKRRGVKAEPKEEEQENKLEGTPTPKQKQHEAGRHVESEECGKCGGSVRPQAKHPGYYMLRCMNVRCRKWWGRLKNLDGKVQLKGQKSLRSVQYPTNIEADECTKCGGLVRPQAKNHGYYAMRCSNKRCRKWWRALNPNSSSMNGKRRASTGATGERPCNKKGRRRSSLGEGTPGRLNCIRCEKKVNTTNVVQHILKVHLMKNLLSCNICKFETAYDVIIMEKHFSDDHPAKEMSPLLYKNDGDFYKSDIIKDMAQNFPALNAAVIISECHAKSRGHQLYSVKQEEESFVEESTGDSGNGNLNGDISTDDLDARANSLRKKEDANSTEMSMVPQHSPSAALSPSILSESSMEVGPSHVHGHSIERDFAAQSKDEDITVLPSAHEEDPLTSSTPLPTAKPSRKRQSNSQPQAFSEPKKGRPRKSLSDANRRKSSTNLPKNMDFTDEHMDKISAAIQKAFKSIGGLRKVSVMQAHPGQYLLTPEDIRIQFHKVKGNHWVVSVKSKCSKRVLKIYSSLPNEHYDSDTEFRKEILECYSDMKNEFKELTVKLFCPKPESEAHNSGPLAAAFAIDVAVGNPPEGCRYFKTDSATRKRVINEVMMNSGSGKFSEFGVKRERKEWKGVVGTWKEDEDGASVVVPEKTAKKDHRGVKAAESPSDDQGSDDIIEVPNVTKSGDPYPTSAPSSRRRRASKKRVLSPFKKTPVNSNPAKTSTTRAEVHPVPDKVQKGPSQPANEKYFGEEEMDMVTSRIREAFKNIGGLQFQAGLRAYPGHFLSDSTENPKDFRIQIHMVAEHHWVVSVKSAQGVKIYKTLPNTEFGAGFRQEILQCYSDILNENGELRVEHFCPRVQMNTDLSMNSGPLAAAFAVDLALKNPPEQCTYEALKSVIRKRVVRDVLSGKSELLLPFGARSSEVSLSGRSETWRRDSVDSRKQGSESVKEDTPEREEKELEKSSHGDLSEQEKRLSDVVDEVAAGDDHDTLAASPISSSSKVSAEQERQIEGIIDGVVFGTPTPDPQESTDPSTPRKGARKPRKPASKSQEASISLQRESDSKHESSGDEISEVSSNEPDKLSPNLQSFTDKQMDIISAVIQSTCPSIGGLQKMSTMMMNPGQYLSDSGAEPANFRIQLHHVYTLVPGSFEWGNYWVVSVAEKSKGIVKLYNSLSPSKPPKFGAKIRQELLDCYSDMVDEKGELCVVHICPKQQSDNNHSGPLAAMFAIDAALLGRAPENYLYNQGREMSETGIRKRIVSEVLEERRISVFGRAKRRSPLAGRVEHWALKDTTPAPFHKENSAEGTEKGEKLASPVGEKNEKSESPEARENKGPKRSSARKGKFCQKCKKQVSANIYVHIYHHLNKDLSRPRFECMMDGCAFEGASDKQIVSRHMRVVHDCEAAEDDNMVNNTSDLVELYDEMVQKCFGS